MLQVAQRVGGDFDFWQSSITTYVDCRLAAPHTTTSDAKEALMGGIAMFSAIARWAQTGGARGGGQGGGVSKVLYVGGIAMFSAIARWGRGLPRVGGRARGGRSWGASPCSPRLQGGGGGC